MTRHRIAAFAAGLVLVLLGLRSVDAQANDTSGHIRSMSFERGVTARGVEAFSAPLFEGYEQPESLSGVDIFAGEFFSTYPDGQATPVRVQVFLPNGPIRGSYLFMPGSTGLINVCRASREHEAGIRWGLYRAHTMMMASQGFVGILPDYMGFEDHSLVQPYFHASSEARVLFDALHAVSGWLKAESPERFPDGLQSVRRVAAGFSQGGHAVFAAADRNQDMGGLLYLHGVIGYGPTTDIEPMLLRYPSLGPMVAMSYLTVYGRENVDPGALFQSPWAEDIEYDTTRQCVGGMQGFYPAYPNRLFEPDFLHALETETLGSAFPTLARIFAANQTGRSGHGTPSLILQGTDDIVVSRKTQDRVVAEMRAAGNPVDYLVFDGYRHDTRQIGFEAAIEWILARDVGDRPAPMSQPRRFDRDIDE